MGACMHTCTCNHRPYLDASSLSGQHKTCCAARQPLQVVDTIMPHAEGIQGSLLHQASSAELDILQGPMGRHRWRCMGKESGRRCRLAVRRSQRKARPACTLYSTNEAFTGSCTKDASDRHTAQSPPGAGAICRLSHQPRLMQRCQRYRGSRPHGTLGQRGQSRSLCSCLPC